jgi:hypothetical protein
MLHEYHVIYSARYYPRFHVTAGGLGTYYPWIRRHYLYCRRHGTLHHIPNDSSVLHCERYKNPEFLRHTTESLKCEKFAPNAVLPQRAPFFNICRLRQKHIQSGFEYGNLRAAESSSWYDCQVNVLAKRQKTRYESTVQGSTRLSRQSLLELPHYVTRFPLLSWQNFFCFWRNNSESAMFFL